MMFMDNHIERNLDWLGSVWRVTTVNPNIQQFNLDHYHGASFPEDLVYRLIHIFSTRNDVVLDPFCGLGTTNHMALALNRQTVGYDIEKKFIEIAKKRCKGGGKFFCKSSENMEEIPDNNISLCITSPPYLDVKKYSDNPDNIGNKEEPKNYLKKNFEEIYRVLKSNGYFCLNVASVAKKGFLDTFPFDLIYICKDIGFKFRSTILWDKGLKIKRWNIDNKEIAENHEYIWVFKK